MSENNTKRTELGELGEFALIDRLTKDFSAKNKSTLKGVGDDAAVIDNAGFETLVSTDLFLEGIHFDLAYMPLQHLGYKSVIINLSDIYAMNAIPEQITISLGISNRFSVEALEQFYEGVQQACKKYNVDFVGGDTTSSLKGLIISVTAIGKAKKEDITYRTGAKEGDIVCVTGDLGAAFMGLQILNREKEVYAHNAEIQPDLSEHKYLVGRQLKPEANVALIKYFAENDIKPTSMIDVSDGLSSEVLHIAKQSDVGFQIFDANLPISKEVFDQAIALNIDPMMCALSGGEDYELLFTIDPKDEAKLNEDEIDFTVIGKVINKEEGCYITTSSNNNHKLIAQGWK
jgi:thiamine-monophosphate kinase